MNMYHTLSRRAGAFTKGLDKLGRIFILTMCCVLGAGCAIDADPIAPDPGDPQDELADDSTAQARCNGNRNPVTSHLVVSGTVYVTEVPAAGSCNANNTYQGYFRSSFNGWRASAWIQNNGSWTGWYGGFNTNWYYYSYQDNNSNSYIHLCLDNGSYYYCGWGSNWSGNFYPNHTHYGLNHGF